MEKCGTAGRATDDNIARRMRFACWITKPLHTPHTHTHTHRIYNTYCFSTATIVFANAPQYYVILRCLSSYKIGTIHYISNGAYILDAKCVRCHLELLLDSYQNLPENQMWCLFPQPDRTQHPKLILSVNSKLATSHARAVSPSLLLWSIDSSQLPSQLFATRYYYWVTSLR